MARSGRRSAAAASSVTNRLLYNKWILYLFLVLTFIQFAVTVGGGNINAAAVLVLGSFVTSFFSPNMMVVLAAGLILSVVYQYGLEPFVRREGMKGDSEEEDEENFTEGAAGADGADEEEDDEEDPRAKK